MINCIIIEDQPPAQRILKKYIEDIDSLELKATFADAVKAMTFLQKETVDVIFLDIHLPKLSGIEFLKTLQSKPAIILTTAFPDYALESYEFDVVDYLLKPFSFQRFLKAVSKISTNNQEINIPSPKQGLQSQRKEVFIKSGYEHIRIYIENILYIKSDVDYTEIILEEKKHLSSEPLKYWLSMLDTNQFIRVHKSYIINSSKIEKIVGNMIYLTSQTQIPIGRTYKEDLVKRFLS